jgi:hypothetical protein
VRRLKPKLVQRQNAGLVKKLHAERHNVKRSVTRWLEPLDGKVEQQAHKAQQALAQGTKVTPMVVQGATL